MLLNSNELYSAMNNIEKINNEEIKIIIEQVQTLKTLKTSQEAKEFCEKNYGVFENVTNYPLNSKCFLTIKELDNTYSFNFMCADEVYSINYKKGVNNG